MQAHLVIPSLLLSCMPSCTVPSACRGSLQIGDLLSDLAAAPMEVTIGGTDGWVHQVRYLGHVSSTWSAAGAVVWHHVLNSLQQALCWQSSASPCSFPCLAPMQGIFEAATYIHCSTQEALQEAARRCPGWPLLVTGHSLGGQGTMTAKAH